MKIILSIDQGTSSTRCLLFQVDDKQFLLKESHQVSLTQVYPQVGWIEQDPIEIWNTVKTCMTESITKLSSYCPAFDIITIGITNQRETTIIWNKTTGKPYYNAIVWNDTRTQNICDQLSKGEIYKYQNITGLPIGLSFVAFEL